jgi:sulfur carrier protein ThiS
MGVVAQAPTSSTQDHQPTALPWPPPHSLPLARQAAADPPGMATAVADSHANCRGRRRAALRGASVTVLVEGRTRSLPAGLTTEQALRRLGLPAAGDLLAVDHSVLRKGAYPPKVLVNGQPAPTRQRLHRGDRVTVSRGRTRIEPVARVTQLLAASRPGNPMRWLPTGPAQAVLDRGKLSGHVVPVAYHPAPGTGGPLPVALTFDDGPWPHSHRPDPDHRRPATGTGHVLRGWPPSPALPRTCPTGAGGRDGAGQPLLQPPAAIRPAPGGAHPQRDRPRPAHPGAAGRPSGGVPATWRHRLLGLVATARRRWRPCRPSLMGYAAWASPSPSYPPEPALGC